MQRKVAIVVLLVILLLSLTPQALQAKPEGKVVFILMDNVTWEDIIAANDPILNDLVKNSSIGLLNNRGFKMPSRPRNALSVGSGLRAEGSAASFEEYNATEPYGDELAMDAYALRTGKKASKHQVVELGIASIVKDNENGLQEFIPGLLASTLKQAGRSTAVIGNSDTSLDYEPESCNREAVAIAMDNNGLVEYGDVGKDLLLRDKEYPFGIRTNYTKLKQRYEEFYNKADFIVVDLGDTTRADLYSRYAFKNQASRHKNRAIHAGARFIKQAMDFASNDTTFIIASLSPPGSNKYPLKLEYEQLTPIIMHGPAFGRGNLISNTTRREGIVTTIDIAPTILSIMGLQKPINMSGSSLYSIPIKVDEKGLDSFNQSAVGIKGTRRTAVLAYIYIQLAICLLAALVLAFRKMLNHATVTLLETLIFATMAYPLLSFYTTKFASLADKGFIVTLLTLAASLVFASILMIMRKNVLNPIIGITAIIVGVLSIDALVGAPSFINSIFGYDPIRGARFYGIGNEGMAILIANTLLLFGMLLEKYRNKWAIPTGLLLCLVITFIIGFPKIGANTGGTITAVFAFTVMLLLTVKSRLTVKDILVAFLAVVLVLGGFVAYDVLHGAATHMGKTVNLIETEGFAQIAMIANRKLAVNLMILRYSTWSYFLLFALGLLIFLWFRPVGVLKGLLANHKGLSIAIPASIVGGIAGFAFNDSGILIPAIMMSYIIPTVIYLMIWEQYHSKG